MMAATLEQAMALFLVQGTIPKAEPAPCTGSRHGPVPSAHSPFLLRLRFESGRADCRRGLLGFAHFYFLWYKDEDYGAVALSGVLRKCGTRPHL